MNLSEEHLTGALMKTCFKLLVVLNILSFLGCATTGSQYFDSALNDHNRAPASLMLPKNYDLESPVIDPVHNQAEADFLFLKADLESQLGHANDAIENLKSALVYDPQSATMMQKMAVEYYRKGQLRDSLYWAERAQQISPYRRDLSLLVAGLFSSTKNYEKAETIYRNLIKSDPEDQEAKLYLGAAYSEQKNYKKSAEYFLQVTKEKNPSKYLAHFYLARVYLEQGGKANTKKARLELQKTIDIRPDFFDAISLLGQILQKEKGPEETYKFYAQVQKTKGPLPKLAEILSQYYIEKGEYDKGYEQLEILDNTSDDQIQVKLKMALILIDKKIYNLAIEKLDEILKVAPESDKVRFYLSAVYEEKKQYQEAFDQYLQIAKGSSYFEESRVHAAYLAKLLGHADEGLKIVTEVVAGKVTNIQTYFLAAQFHEDQKAYDKSISVVKIAQKTFPKNAQAHFYEGTLLDKLNRKKEMLQSMETALEIEPDNIQTMNYIAFSLAEMNEQLEKAELLARQAVQKEKNDGFILDTLGWVLFKKGQYKEAVTVLEKAHEIQPAVGIIAEHLGDVYIKVQKLGKAKALLLKATELESDQSRKQDIRIKISQLEMNLKNQIRTPASNDFDSKKDVSP